MVSLFNESHFEFFRTDPPSDISKRSLALKCYLKKDNAFSKLNSNLNPDLKKKLRHHCPALPGASGSLINFSCGRAEKKGIFVASTGLASHLLPYSYSYANEATPITKNLLNRAFERFCKL